jgi:hypothetical protein
MAIKQHPFLEREGKAPHFCGTSEHIGLFQESRTRGIRSSRTNGGGPRPGGDPSGKFRWWSYSSTSGGGRHTCNPCHDAIHGNLHYPLPFDIGKPLNEAVNFKLPLTRCWQDTRSVWSNISFGLVPLRWGGWPPAMTLDCTEARARGHLPKSWMKALEKTISEVHEKR